MPTGLRGRETWLDATIDDNLTLYSSSRHFSDSATTCANFDLLPSLNGQRGSRGILPSFCPYDGCRTSFATNLFVGAVIETYQALSSEDASLLMTDAQRSWVELQKMASLASLKPLPRRPAG